MKKKLLKQENTNQNVILERLEKIEKHLGIDNAKGIRQAQDDNLSGRGSYGGFKFRKFMLQKKKYRTIIIPYSTYKRKDF